MRSYYLALIGRRQQSSFPWKAIWISKAPCRVAFFVWEGALDDILTGDSLRERKRIYVNWCFMCKGDEESVNHFLLHYFVAWEL